MLLNDIEIAPVQGSETARVTLEASAASSTATSTSSPGVPSFSFSYSSTLTFPSAPPASLSDDTTPSLSNVAHQSTPMSLLSAAASSAATLGYSSVASGCHQNSPPLSALPLQRHLYHHQGYLLEHRVPAGLSRKKLGRRKKTGNLPRGKHVNRRQLWSIFSSSFLRHLFSSPAPPFFRLSLGV